MTKRAGSAKTRNFLQYSTALVGMAALATMLTPGAAFAQDGAGEDDEIVVTGTRIPRPEFELSNPVASVDEQAIQQSGQVNLTDFVQDMPALLNSFDSEDSADTGGQALAGLNLLNLRNLGTERTLVLVNGRRHVASLSGTQSVDVNSIPVDLVERIDVLTGGASAIYGADGVTGVVNFILKDDFEGISTRAQYGWSQEGGGETSFLSFIAGQNINNDRGNLTFAFEWSDTEPLNREDRDYARTGNREILVGNPAEVGGPDDPNVPDNIFLRDIRYIDTSPGGSVFTVLFGPSLSGVTFEGDGDPWVDGINTDNFTMQGGSGSLLDRFVDELLPGIERYSFNLNFRHDLVGQHEFYLETKFVHAETAFVPQPTFDLDYAESPFRFLGIFISPDNPYIPASIATDAALPGNIYDQIGGLLMYRDNFDLPNPRREIERETARIVAGLRGPVTDRIDYDVSFVFGDTTERNIYRNNRNNERWLAAIDAVDDGSGNIVCRSDLDPLARPLEIPESVWGSTFTPGPGSGCVPLNIFGEGNMSQAGIDWVLEDIMTRTNIQQHVFTAYMAGDLFDMWAGPLAFALGIERREESSDFTTSNREREAAAVPCVGCDSPFGFDLTWAGQGTDVSGKYDVTEAFVEFNVPLVRDVPVIESLSVEAAYRYSDYSTGFTTDTWKVGGIWELTDWFLLRATQAQAIRTPNIGELFTPQTQTFELLTDPCDDSQVNLGTSERFNNCNNALLALGAPGAGTFNNTLSSAVQGRTGGNPDLKPEQAETITYGFVFQPTFLRGFSFALDYYNVQLTDAIQEFGAQTILDLCYDLAQPNQFCPLITRQNGSGLLTFFEQFTVNVATYETSGWDAAVRYNLDPSEWWSGWNFGEFQMAVLASKVDELSFTELDTPVDQLADPATATPEWQAVFDLTWVWGPLRVNYGYSWFDETPRVDALTIAAEPDWVDPSYFNFSERSVHDFFVSYDFTQQLQVYGGVNNFTNQEPDRGSLDTPVSPLGRFFYVGARARFN